MVYILQSSQISINKQEELKTKQNFEKLDDEVSKLEVQKPIIEEDLIQNQEQIKVTTEIKEKENEIEVLQQNFQHLTKEKSELEEKLSKKISELEIELTKKEKIIEEDKKIICNYENSNNLLQEQKGKLEDEISKLKEKNQIIEKNLFQIQEQVKVSTETSQKQNFQLQEQIIEKQEIIKQKDNEITALQQNSQNLTKEKTELEEELAVKERIIEGTNENLNIQEEKGKLENEISKLKEKNQIIEKDLIQAQEQIKANIEISQKQNDQLQEKIFKKQEKIRQKENEIEALQQNSQNLTKEKTEIEEELDKKISELEIELVKKEKIIETANKETVHYHKISNHLQEEKEELEDELETLKKELNHEIKTLIKNKEEKQQKINELAEEMEKEKSRLVKVKELKNNIKQLKIQNEESKQSLIDTQSKLSEIKAIPLPTDKIDKFTKTKIKQKKKELENLKEELKSDQKQLENMEKKLNNLLGLIGKFTVNISSKNITKLGKLVKEKEELIEKINKLKKNKLAKEKKIKTLTEKIQDEDWKKKCQGLQETIDKKNQIIEEFTKKLPRKILLIGRTGSGLANVLTGTNQFKESNYSISQTKTIQRCQFVEEEITYEVIDTIGLNDTKLNREDILYKLAELARELKDGLHQILLVTNGRFTEEEIQVYQILETVLFDENVKNYTTIVRTNFEKFENEEECQNNQRLLIEEKSQIMTIIKSCNFFIHLDNPSNDISKRKKSKIILLTHLNKQIGVYRPSNLEKLNERIMDYMKYENRELVIQEMDKHV
ncbi:unnamed protein product [Rhizophagus irregularis]|uniref:AIG1-type G domain-containing protein n=1 Tax=Rhizophagus irregularis TaxID=588596 RepID=A0A915Z9F9_9GLOM|nr:unnamed protein product [Rhizophagus irregularis]